MPAQEEPFPLKVALVTQGYETGGGVATVAKWLRTELTAGGHQVTVFDLAASARDESSRRLLCPRTWLHRSLRRPLENPLHGYHWGANAVEFEPMRYVPRVELRRALQSFDVIQVVAGGPALANAALGAGVPVVLQAATFARWERAPRLHALTLARRFWSTGMTALIGRMERRALRLADAVLVWNPQMQQAVRSHRSGQVDVAAPGVDVERFKPMPEGWRRDGHVLSVCRLSDGRKRLDLVLRSYAAMVAQDPSVPGLVLAGQGQLPDREIALIGALGLHSRVTIMTDVPAEELPRLYRSGSVYIQASSEEGFGLSVVEAMASGLPVVATETAGTAMTVVDGRTGRLVRLSAPEVVAKELASSALQVLNASGSNMSIAARTHVVSSFATEVSLRRFLQIYAETALGSTSSRIR